jgi:phosphoglycerate dehydrogenase-like enzyme
MKILVAMPAGEIRDSFIPYDTKKKLEALGEITWNGGTENFSTDELRGKIAGFDICITGWGSAYFDESVLDNSDALKLIAHTGGTVAPYVGDAVYGKGIKVISGNTMYAESVAEGTVAYILGSLRDIVYYNNEVQQGRWRSDIVTNEGLLDQTVGLIGYGAIARHVVQMLKPFRTKIKVYSRHISAETCRESGIKKATLEDIFSTCKVISLHSALTPDTHHMIGRELLSMIPDGSVLINTARGAIIDESALEQELVKKRFKAVLDVFEVEPLPMGSKLRGLDHVILIPHMGGPTLDRWKMITEELIKDIQNFWKNGNLKYEISREYSGTMTRKA